jgi:hypothetical protein
MLTDAKGYTGSVEDDLNISTEYWWNNTDRGKQKYL